MRLSTQEKEMNADEAGELRECWFFRALPLYASALTSTHGSAHNPAQKGLLLNSAEHGAWNRDVGDK
jgi:hypothetical protein